MLNSSTDSSLKVTPVKNTEGSHVRWIEMTVKDGPVMMNEIFRLQKITLGLVAVCIKYRPNANLIRDVTRKGQFLVQVLSVEVAHITIAEWCDSELPS